MCLPFAFISIAHPKVCDIAKVDGLIKDIALRIALEYNTLHPATHGPIDHDAPANDDIRKRMVVRKIVDDAKLRQDL